MFAFKQFTIHQERSAMKVTTDSCLFGAWVGFILRENMPPAHFSLLDIGTGTGLLSLMIAQAHHQAQITAVEVDGDASRQAVENVNDSPWHNRILVMQANILDWNPGFAYDIIVSNPPFYENELHSLDARRNLAHHSSDLRLEQLLEQVKKLLKTGGRFYLLLPYKRREELRPLFTAAGLGIVHICLVRQTPGHDYFRMMVEGMVNGGSETGFDEMVIKEKNGEYSDAFVGLLRPYYLKL